MYLTSSNSNEDKGAGEPIIAPPTTSTYPIIAWSIEIALAVWNPFVRSSIAIPGEIFPGLLLANNPAASTIFSLGTPVTFSTFSGV